MSSGKILAGLLAGVAAGAIIAILMAPDKGSKTIENLVHKKDDITDQLKEKALNFLFQLMATISPSKTRSSKISEVTVTESG